MTAAVFAHQGGWDEILVVLLPLFLFGGLLYMARRRADEMAAKRPESDPPDDDAS